MLASIRISAGHEGERNLEAADEIAGGVPVFGLLGPVCRLIGEKKKRFRAIRSNHRA